MCWLVRACVRACVCVLVNVGLWVFVCVCMCCCVCVCVFAYMFLRVCLCVCVWFVRQQRQQRGNSNDRQRQKREKKAPYQPGNNVLTRSPRVWTAFPQNKKRETRHTALEFICFTRSRGYGRFSRKTKSKKEPYRLGTHIFYEFLKGVDGFPA